MKTAERKAVLRAFAEATGATEFVPLWGMRDGSCACSKVGCKTPGKHPIREGWRESRLDLEAACRQLDRRRDGCNIGWFVPPGLVVLDPDSAVEVALLEVRAADARRTLTVLTGRGRHVVFRLPESDGKVALDVEVRLPGRMLVAPGSRHWKGAVYTFAPGPILPCPAALIGPAATAYVPAAEEVTVAETTPAGRRELDKLKRNVERAPEGTRSKTLLYAALKAGSLTSGGEIAPGHAERVLVAAATARRPRPDEAPGLSEAEAKRAFGWGYDHGLQSPRSISRRGERRRQKGSLDVEAVLARVDGPPGRALRPEGKQALRDEPLVVLDAVLGLMGGKGQASVSAHELEKRLGKSRSSVVGCLKSLEQHGILSITPQTHPSGRNLSPLVQLAPSLVVPLESALQARADVQTASEPAVRLPARPPGDSGRGDGLEVLEEQLQGQEGQELLVRGRLSGRRGSGLRVADLDGAAAGEGRVSGADLRPERVGLDLGAAS